MRAANATAAIVVALTLGVSGVASADEPMLFDRRPQTSTIGVDVALGSVADELQSGFTVLRLDGHGVALSRSGRFGAVITVPLSIVRQENATEAALGNIEGGVIARLVTRNGIHAVSRVTLTLPTADGTTAGAIANGVAALLRVNDLALALPETMSLRATGSVTYTERFFFVRADLGVDTPLLESSSRITDLSRVPLFRVNAAIGVVTGGGVTLALESANTLATDNAFDAFGVGNARGVVHQLGVSGRTAAGTHLLSGGLFVDPSNVFGSDDGYSVAAVLGITRPL